MSHRNAPLTPEGRLRLIQRCQSRPLSHVAAEAGVSRACLSKWRARYQQLGEAGLTDRSSAPVRSPTQLSDAVVARIEQLRRDRKYSAARIALELTGDGHRVSVRTVGRCLLRLGINRRRYLDVDGADLRRPGRIVAGFPGHLIHLDVKKVGRIPDGGGWRAHGKDSEQHRAADRAKRAGARAGYTYLHSIIDGFSRLAYTEPLDDETAATTIGFFCRARAFFAATASSASFGSSPTTARTTARSPIGRTARAFASRHVKLSAVAFGEKALGLSWGSPCRRAPETAPSSHSRSHPRIRLQ